MLILPVLTFYLHHIIGSNKKLNCEGQKTTDFKSHLRKIWYSIPCLFHTPSHEAVICAEVRIISIIEGTKTYVFYGKTILNSCM